MSQTSFVAQYDGTLDCLSWGSLLRQGTRYSNPRELRSWETLPFVPSTPIPLLFLLQLWDTVSGQLAFQHTCPKSLNCIAFHPEGQVVATGNWAGSLTFFQADGLKVIKVQVLCGE